MSEAKPRAISTIPRAYGESIRRAMSSAALKRVATRRAAATPAVDR